MLKTGVVLSVPIIVAAAVAIGPSIGRPSSNAATGSPVGVEIPGPASWVPFQADWEKTKTGVDPLRGRFVRGEDGSERSESIFEWQDRPLITIMNVGRNTYYEQSTDGVWCAHPMRVGTDGYFPLRMRSNANLTFTKLPETLEGLDVYQRASKVSAIVEYVAPALNFFPILIETAGTDERKRFLNIRMGPVDSREFFPPPGVAVIQHQNLRGIIQSVPGQPEPTLAQLKEHK